MAPEAPIERVRAVRAAFDAMVKDLAFILEAEKQNRDIDYVSGKEMQKLIVEMAQTATRIMSRVEELMQFRAP